MRKMNKGKKIKCVICGEQTNFYADNFYNHLKRNHYDDVKTNKEYYDKYIKKNGDDICNNRDCNKITTFAGLNRGYLECCSIKCSNTSEQKSRKISESFKYRDIEKGNEKRKKTKQERYGDPFYRNKNKYEKTMIDRYGTKTNLSFGKAKENRIKSLEENKEEINTKRKAYWTQENIQIALDKRINTCNEKYGTDSIMKLDKIKDQIRNTNMDSGYWHDYDNIDNSIWKEYKMAVWDETKKYINQLFEDWDGACYYSDVDCLSNEEYKKLHPNKHINTNGLQPNIDHKISIYYGFLNKIDIKVIGNIDNLCICCRHENAKKHCKIDEEYMKVNNDSKKIK